MSNKTIDEILNQLQYGTIMSNNQAMLTNNRNIATKAITQAMLDIVGEDEKQQWFEDYSMCNNCDFQLVDDTKDCLCIVRNQLRAEIRTAIKKIGGSDENTHSL